jgi:hypothetical protein
MRLACREEFERLCALFTASSLNAEETARLNDHLTTCSNCREVLGEYRSLVSDFAAQITTASDECALHHEEWKSAEAESQAKNSLLQNLKVAALQAQSGSRTGGVPLKDRAPAAKAQETKKIAPSMRVALKALPIAAVLVVGLALSYEFGVRHGVLHAAEHGSGDAQSVAQPIAPIPDRSAEREALTAQLATTYRMIDQLKDRARTQEKALSETIGVKTSLEQKLHQLSTQNRDQADALDSVSAQRDALQRQLDEANVSLQSVENDLNGVREERQKAQLHMAGLEAKIDQLSTELRDTTAAANRQEEFLSSDRDIRELMGARQLYIADVFDVDQNGHKRKPYGRVFYTKGKSLIFYAFDLDEHPGFRKTKSFQVWGSPSEDQTHAVSLGIFYMDSEANRRWVFKSDDPVVLAQVNSVFVTVEPKGESKSPSSKPILYAYLRTAPTNHP